MRAKRLKPTARTAIYHLISRTVAGEHLLEQRADQAVLRKQIREMAAFCGLKVLTYCILSNHFHLLIKAPPKEDLPNPELVRRFSILYGPDKARTLEKNLRSSPNHEAIRNGLLKRMNDISFFMKELKMRFTIYYNKTYGRFGTLWAEPFKSLLVESKGRRDAVLAVAAYIDLNPVRAGLCGDPKDYHFSGYGEAVGTSGAARSGLCWIVGRQDWSEASRLYRTALFGIGGNRDRAKGVRIDPEKCREVFQAGGELPLASLLRCRVRYFSDGIALGTARFVARARESAFGKSTRPSSARTPKMPVIEETELHFARGKPFAEQGR